MSMQDHHVHHLAKRLHQAHSKLDALTSKLHSVAERTAGTLEVAGGAFLGGVLEGKTQGGAFFGHLPYNLTAAGVLLGVGYAGLAGEYSEHIQNLGTGVLAGYIASKGYAFGQRWHDTGKILGGGDAAPSLPPGPVVQGELSPQQMQAMVNNMTAAGVGG